MIIFWDALQMLSTQQPDRYSIGGVQDLRNLTPRDVCKIPAIKSKLYIPQGIF
jgi:hypothetical protein